MIALMFQGCEIRVSQHVERSKITLAFQYVSESFLNNGGAFCFHKAHSFVFASQGFDLWCEKQPSYINNLVPTCLHSNGA